MRKPRLTGKAQTVLGLIPAEELGITLPHEHLLIAIPRNFVEPTAVTEKALAHQPVSMENLHWVRYHYGSNLDNLILMDEKVAIDEALRFKWLGGKTIIDFTNIGLGRDPLALRRISLATGLNIIMGSGYYVGPSHPPDIAKKNEEEIAEEIARDITIGVGDTGIRAGIIGEIGTSWPLMDNERKVLRAAAIAQRRTSTSVNVHPGRNARAPFDIIKLLSDAGGDIARTVMSHLDRTLRDLDDLLKLAKTGCYIEYDLCGWEGYYPLLKTIDLPNDAQRVNEIKELIAEGYVNQILISQDICQKADLYCFGGRSYCHILERMVPLMRDKGISEEHIDTILVGNAKRLLQFA